MAAPIGSPGEHQLNVLPSNVIGTPKSFEYHPFHLIDFKEQAYIRKQAAGRTAERIPTCSAEFFMDFAFMHASTEDYKWPNKATDRVVTSYDGYSSHLVIVDSASRRVWAFLMKSKDPPINILRAFLKKFGVSMGVIRTDQGGKLARRDTLHERYLRSSGTLSNQQVRTVPYKTVALRATTTLLRLRSALCCMALVSLLASGPLHSSMRYTYTTASSILPLAGLHTRVGMVVNQMSHTLICLVHESV